MQIPADCDTMKEEGREHAIETTSTKNALAAAMRAMLAETAFSRISISALCQRCGVNRKSFYYHFRDKYDLVCWIFQWEYLEQATAKNYSSDREAFLALCQYLDQNRSFYRKVMRVEGQNCFRDYFETSIKNLLCLGFEQKPHSDVDIVFFSEFMARALCAAITEWIRDAKGLSSAEFAEKIQMCVDIIRASAD